MPTIVSCVSAVGQFWREAITHTQAITHAPFCPCLIGLPPTRSGSPLTSSIPLPVKLGAVEGLPLPARNYYFVLTSLVLGGLHQGSGVALPTGGRVDPAIGNEELAGTRYVSGSTFARSLRFTAASLSRLHIRIWYIIPGIIRMWSYYVLY